MSLRFLAALENRFVNCPCRVSSRVSLDTSADFQVNTRVARKKRPPTIWVTVLRASFSAVKRWSGVALVSPRAWSFGTNTITATEINRRLEMASNTEGSLVEG